eukprot:762625-Hanusia_phi.AAC.1
MNAPPSSALPTITSSRCLTGGTGGCLVEQENFSSLASPNHRPHCHAPPPLSCLSLASPTHSSHLLFLAELQRDSRRVLERIVEFIEHGQALAHEQLGER